MTTEQLGGLDTAFVYCETPVMHMHVCALVILDPPPAGTDLYGRIRSLLAEAAPRVLLMRKRIVPMPLGMGRPIWVDDPDFDVDRHLQRVEVPAPGDQRALAELAGSIAEVPLQRDRPLWEVSVMEGLADGRVALLAKMHHATIDGLSAVTMMGQLFDLEPDPPKPTESGSESAGPAPGNLDLLGRSLKGILRYPFELAGLIPATAIRVGGAAAGLLARRHEPTTAARPFSAPRTSFNATLTSKRALAFTDLPLADMKKVKLAYGVKFNDVVTAVVSGAIRRYLDDRGETPTKSLIAAAPVSVHGRSEGLAGMTRLSMIFSSLATDVDDPRERLEVIAAANSRAKEINNMMGDDTLMRWSEQVWPPGFWVGSHLYSGLHLADRHPVVFNLLLSNFPGPPTALYMGGARSRAIYPFGPLFDGAGLNVTVMSLEDRVGFGIVTCPDLVPDAWRIAELLEPALAELVTSAQHAPVQQAPADHEPAQHEPAQHEPAQHEPAQHEPAQHAPIDEVTPVS